MPNKKGAKMLEKIPGFFELIADSSFMGIWVLDPKGITLYANDGMATMLGYVPDEMLGESFLDFMSPEMRSIASAHLARRNTGIAEIHDFTFRHRDGTKVVTRIATNPVYDDEGKTIGALAIIEDRTKITDAEARMDLLQHHLERISAKVSDCFWRTRISADGKAMVEYVSSGWTSIWGYEPEELYENPALWAECVVPEDRHAATQAFARVIDKGIPTTALYRIKNKGGDIRFIEDRMALDLALPNGEKWVDGIARDVTDRHELEQQIQTRQRQESLELLAGGVAHDFNNLLGGIQTRLSLILDELPETDSPLRKDVDVIDSLTVRASELCSQLLAYSGRGAYTLEVLDLSELVRALEPLAKSMAPKGMRLTLSLQDEVAPIKVDPTQLRRVILNLIMNAAEASVDSREICIETGTATCCGADGDGRYLLNPLPESKQCTYLRVTDRGRGMPPDLIPNIFDPFFTTKGPGRGLGLAAVQGIVKSYDGALSVDSKVDEGTSVTVYVPVTDEKLGRSKADDSSTEASPRETILLVDDEHFIRDNARAILERRGYLVVDAAGGQEAVAIVAAAPDKFDAVLLDIVMPDLSGQETHAAIRKLNPRLPILLSSGYSKDIVSQLTEADEITSFLQKPYRGKKLLESLQELLRQNAKD